MVRGREATPAALQLARKARRIRKSRARWMKSSQGEEQVWNENFIQLGPTTARRRTSYWAELLPKTPPRGRAKPYPTRKTPPRKLRSLEESCPSLGTTAAHRTYGPPGNDGMDTSGRRRNAGTQLRTNGLPTIRGQVIDLAITHSTQVRFTCPVCSLTYPAHSSLTRHVGVAHKSVHLEITFKCALCDYTHASKRSTSLHFRHAHGAAVPPATINGCNEKACPFCPLTFPSSHSCSTHIREKHMTEACQQRAREAAQKEAQRGESTAQTKWTQRETEAFKTASNHWIKGGMYTSFCEYRFAHKARVNLLPTHNVRRRSGEAIQDVSCPKCHQEQETLAHILNHCPSHVGLVRARHNNILPRLARAIPPFKGVKLLEQVVPGDTRALKPDLVVLNEARSEAYVIDVTVPFEGEVAFRDAREAKEEKYDHLKAILRAKGYHKVEVDGFVIGALGSWDPENEPVLRKLSIGPRYATLFRKLCCSEAIKGSYAIWRNKTG